MTQTQAQILVVSFSNIAKDARVLRQLGVVREFGHVTTVGYGPNTGFADEHIQVPDSAKSLPQTVPGVAKLGLHLFEASEFAAPGLAYAHRQLRGRHFDAVIANDARALPVAFAAANDTAPVWVDLHEWAPEERTHVLSWRLLVAPYMTYLCKKYLPRTAHQTTVGRKIAELYQEHFGVSPQLMRNAPAFVDLQPSETAPARIRMVHSGGAVPGRALDKIIQVARELDERFTLDLYLVPANDGGKHLGELRELARGCERITFHDPVKPAELPATLNQYDVGVFWIPPTNTNTRLALPNKLFDFIQGRLAIAVGPTIEMQKLVENYELGVISAGYETDQIIASLNTLTTEQIRHFKDNANVAARDLCFETEAKVAREILREMVG
ncbi:MAG: hypothetical protein Q4A71_07700 [Actinomycetaceae bacterium]|nr:hypothetical protein [Actinomycetaceae bacterium]